MGRWTAIFLVLIGATAPAFAAEETADRLLADLSRRVSLPADVQNLAGQAKAASANRNWPEAIRLHELIHKRVFIELFPDGLVSESDKGRVEIRSDSYVIETKWSHRAAIGWLWLLNMDMGRAESQFASVLSAIPKPKQMVADESRGIALFGMKRTKEMAGRFAEAQKWQEAAAAETRSWCGTCQQPKEFYNYVESEVLKAATGRSPVEGLMGIRLGGLKPSISSFPYNNRSERSYGKRYAAFILGELHYRAGRFEKARAQFDYVIEQDPSVNETVDAFARTYVDKLERR